MTTANTPQFSVAALYAFAPNPEFEARQGPLQSLGETNRVIGTLLLAAEGINGTIAGPADGIEAVIAHIRSWPDFEGLDCKLSFATTPPFTRFKVRLKKEIVTMGVDGLDPRHAAGTYVEAKDWNALIARDDVVVIDTRNDYEVAIGSFEGAIDPNTETFRAFPGWADATLSEIKSEAKKIAMFCTGGIRCEKATAYLKAQGFPEVYHLRGGILKYLEQVPADESLWRGECFVFDQRVSVGHGLEPGPYQLCSVCREPFLSGEGSGGYARRLCPECTANAAPEAKERAAARQRQIDLAARHGGNHLGQPNGPAIKTNAKP